MKLLTIVGARPQFIKAGTISREINKSENVREVIVHTGQHYDTNMSDVFFKEMGIPKPDYYLGVNASFHGSMTGRMMEKIEEIAMKERPDWVLVYGDTNSTLAGALVASKLQIKLAHIEAGLRSYNMKMPEEINRILTDRISTLLFCPTNAAIDNLKKEGFEHFDSKIIMSGDIMYDGSVYYSNYAKKPEIQVSDDFALVTIHRAENTNNLNRLKSIIEALKEVSDQCEIVLPLHPRTKKIIAKNDIDTSGLFIIDPVGYLEMIWLIKKSNIILTDSGGLQKEAYFFKKKCVTLRDETEWIELVDHGYNAVVGADKTKIVEAFNSFEFNSDYSTQLYGDGNSANKIITSIKDYEKEGLDI